MIINLIHSSPCKSSLNICEAHLKYTTLSVYQIAFLIPKVYNLTNSPNMLFPFITAYSVIGTSSVHQHCMATSCRVFLLFAFLLSCYAQNDGILKKQLSDLHYQLFKSVQNKTSLVKVFSLTYVFIFDL